MLKDAGVEVSEEEWTRAECAIRQRRGAKPPTAAVTVVKPNKALKQNLVQGQETVCQDKIAVWVCRDEEQLNKVTTLVQDHETNGHCLKTWT